MRGGVVEVREDGRVARGVGVRRARPLPGRAARRRDRAGESSARKSDWVASRSRRAALRGTEPSSIANGDPVLTPDARFEGWTADDWMRLLHLWKPRATRRARADASARRRHRDSRRAARAEAAAHRARGGSTSPRGRWPIPLRELAAAHERRAGRCRRTPARSTKSWSASARARVAGRTSREQALDAGGDRARDDGRGGDRPLASPPPRNPPAHQRDGAPRDGRGVPAGQGDRARDVPGRRAVDRVHRPPPRPRTST